MAKSKKTKVEFKRRRRNRAVKSGIKAVAGELNQAVSKKDTGAAKDSFAKAVRVLDRAASKGVIHRNTAARRKSRFARNVNLLAAKSDSQ